MSERYLIISFPQAAADGVISQQVKPKHESMREGWKDGGEKSYSQ